MSQGRLLGLPNSPGFRRGDCSTVPPCEDRGEPCRPPHAGWGDVAAGRGHRRARRVAWPRRQECTMDSSTIIWLVVALVALALLALLFSRSRARRADSQRAQAAEIRDEATEHDRRLREREADAQETRA